MVTSYPNVIVVMRERNRPLTAVTRRQGFDGGAPGEFAEGRVAARRHVGEIYGRCEMSTCRFEARSFRGRLDLRS